MRLFERLFVFAAVIAAPAVAYAQATPEGANVTPVDQSSLFSRDRDVSVQDRPRPDYLASGLRLGSLLLYPKIGGNAEYNDNIYATATGKKSDVILRVQPEFLLQSNWSAHYLDLYAKVDADQYVSHSTEDTTDWDVGTDGRLDIVRGTDIKAGAQAARITVPRTSPGSVGAAVPDQYDYNTAYLSGEREVDRVKVSVKGGWDHYNYFDVPQVGGGVIDEADQNRDQFDVGGRIDYAISPGTAWFVEVDGNQRSYQHAADAFNPARTSSGYTVLSGVNFEVTHLVRGEIGAGYLEQDYKSSRYGNDGGVALRAKVEWFPTELTTVTLSGDRSVQDAAFVGAGGYLTTNGGVQIDHELLRNVILSANGGYGHDVYNGVDRQDTRYTAGASINYLLNRHVKLSAGYVYFKQASLGTGRGLNFEVNRLMAGLVLQY
jgi:hypothetical protein